MFYKNFYTHLNKYVYTYIGTGLQIICSSYMDLREAQEPLLYLMLFEI